MKCKSVVNAIALMVMSATSWAANDGADLYKQECVEHVWSIDPYRVLAA